MIKTKLYSGKETIDWNLQKLCTYKKSFFHIYWPGKCRALRNDPIMLTWQSIFHSFLFFFSICSSYGSAWIISFDFHSAFRLTPAAPALTLKTILFNQINVYQLKYLFVHTYQSHWHNVSNHFSIHTRAFFFFVFLLFHLMLSTKYNMSCSRMCMLFVMEFIAHMVCVSGYIRLNMPVWRQNGVLKEGKKHALFVSLCFVLFHFVLLNLHQQPRKIWLKVQCVFFFLSPWNAYKLN